MECKSIRIPCLIVLAAFARLLAEQVSFAQCPIRAVIELVLTSQGAQATHVGTIARHSCRIDAAFVFSPDEALQTVHVRTCARACQLALGLSPQRVGRLRVRMVPADAARVWALLQCVTRIAVALNMEQSNREYASQATRSARAQS